MEYPARLLEGRYWTFRHKEVHSLDAFISNYIDYHESVSGILSLLDRTITILITSKVLIQWLVYKEDGETIENQVLLTAENGESFNEAELLHKVHNAARRELADADNCYFEGLIFMGDNDPDYPGIPVYHVLTGD